MPNEYRIVIIDDDLVVAETPRSISDRMPFIGTNQIKTLQDRDCLKGRERVGTPYDGLKDTFIQFIEDNSLDVIACDINLGDGGQDEWIHRQMIAEMRKHNKTARIISYSGNMGEHLATCIRNRSNWWIMMSNAVSELIKALIDCSDAYAPRSELLSKIVEFVDKPNFPLEVERKLRTEFAMSCFMWSGDSRLSGENLARYIHLWEDAGLRFLRLAMEFGIDNMGALVD